MKQIRLIIASALLLASCGEETKKPVASSVSPAPSAGVASPDTALVETVLKTAPVGQPRAIKDVKAGAKPGEEVTLTGRIMGNVKPFVEGRAAFIMADPSLIKACSDVPGDECETPWDACCDTPEAITKAIATIQIVNAEGRVLKQTLEGAGGLANLSTVTVTGRIAAGSAGDVLIVNATAISVKK